ncbi:MAG TPA: ThiF family adenylyltransferase [Humisphaera sp.]|jgi:molybdopterin/thiamine biosynthesis adenylyltransferase|nr:ThiF family adenylyltransferase [Humisphaera sp.]
MQRYHRQTLLPQIGAQGQAQLAAARVLLIGCGALGTVIAEQLARAGIGFLRIVDRDVVEMTNLQRQVLFDEADAHSEVPKAIAAANRLARINSSITIEPNVTDCHAGNIEELIAAREHRAVDRMHSSSGSAASPSSGTPGEGWGSGCVERASTARMGPHPNPPPEYRRRGQNSSPTLAHAAVDLILDGTDNAETRYLINDAAVKFGIPWIYAACVSMEGRVMSIRPGITPCLRCIFPQPPGPGELPTCDTAGVFAPAAAIVASLQVAAAIKLLVEPQAHHESILTIVDVWTGRFRSSCTEDAKRPDCIACGRRRFEFLDCITAATSTNLCGRNAVQVRPSGFARVDLGQLAVKLSRVGQIERTEHLVRCQMPEPQSIRLTVFPDGRLIVHGTSDFERAKSIYARYVGL